MAAIPVADEAYDVVVAGASFAGLSFAGAAAAHGLRVLVLERDPSVGGVVRTTGILFSDVLDIMDVPPRFRSTPCAACTSKRRTNCPSRSSRTPIVSSWPT